MIYLAACIIVAVAGLYALAAVFGRRSPPPPAPVVVHAPTVVYVPQRDWQDWTQIDADTAGHSIPYKR